jgi:hypothetical protein
MHTRGITDDALTLDENIAIVIESNYLETIKAMMENSLGPGVLLYASKTLSALQTLYWKL